MRAVWLDAGNNPQTALLRKYGITRCYWPAYVNQAPEGEPDDYVLNPMLTEAYFEGWRKGFDVGIYGAASWFGGDPITLARSLDGVLTVCNQTRKQCAVHGNYEHGNALNDLPGQVIRLVQEFRALRPYREFAWVVDEIQGGLFTTALLSTLHYYNVDVMAEAYDGAMDHPYTPDQVRSNLVNFGVPPARAQVKYDGATLTPTTYWYGCVFTQGRLRDL